MDRQRFCWPDTLNQCLKGLRIEKMVNKYFPAENVIELYSLLNQSQIKVWLDGGWGVDALLGKQTRVHQDLDIVIQQKDLVLFCSVLQSKNYKEVLRDDTCAWNFVLGNPLGYEVDVHVISFDVNGNGIYGPITRGVFYPAEALTGMGNIAGVDVKCLSAEYQVQSHTGYTLKDKDFKDVRALCKKFNILLPKEYRI